MRVSRFLRRRAQPIQPEPEYGFRLRLRTGDRIVSRDAAGGISVVTVEGEYVPRPPSDARVLRRGLWARWRSGKRANRRT